MENIQKLIARYPLVEDLVALKETTWFNPGATSLAQGLPYVGLTEQDVNAAHDRLLFRPCKNGWKKSMGKRSTVKCC